MRALALALVLLVTSLTRASASDLDSSRMSTEDLIGSLALIDRPAPGVGDAANYDGFLGDGAPPEFQVGILGVPPPAVPPQMRELVRRGIAVLPSLIAHLNDARPTRLMLGASHGPICLETRSFSGLELRGASLPALGDAQVDFEIVDRVVRRGLIEQYGQEGAAEQGVEPGELNAYLSISPNCEWQRRVRATAPMRTSFIMWAFFGEEYDPRERSAVRRSQSLLGVYPGAPVLGNSYVVQVGDLCFVLVGQIVNRRLTAVRYQPTAGMIVNSPVESPSLRERVVRDWGSLDAAQLRASLLADIAVANGLRAYGPALRRLRFYFPDAYVSLSGLDLEKRKQFEAATGAP